nr:immunoglobulin heavy chain junction region [Macaca mulatta]
CARLGNSYGYPFDYW